MNEIKKDRELLIELSLPDLTDETLNEIIRHMSYEVHRLAFHAAFLRSLIDTIKYSSEKTILFGQIKVLEAVLEKAQELKVNTEKQYDK